MDRHGLTWLAIFAIIITMFVRLPPMVAKQDSVLSTYAPVVEVDALAKQLFVTEIADDRLVHGAIRGMLFELDPYSGYLEPSELAAFERRKDGEYCGLGTEIGMRRGEPTVIAPIEGSPAAKAGVMAGDVILAIDGEQTKGLSIFDINERLTGRAGTIVSLTLRHQGADEPRTLTIQRGPVSVRTVRGFGRRADGAWRFLMDEELRIAYVRITSFHLNTMDDFDQVLDTLERDGMRGLVLDLRFNPGGLLRQAVELVDRFVDDGIIVSTVTRRQAVHWHMAHPPGTNTDLRISVLINGGSASAAEIAAGALQDHGRAVVVGERSFGKGSVQQLIHLASLGAGVKLTVAHYRLPGGRVIHRSRENEHTSAWGVTPDVVVPLRDEEVREIQQSRRTLDLAFGERSDTEATRAGQSRARELIRDRQLIEALNQVVQQLALSTELH